MGSRDLFLTKSKCETIKPFSPRFHSVCVCVCVETYISKGLSSISILIIITKNTWYSLPSKIITISLYDLKVSPKVLMLAAVRDEDY